MRVGDAEGLDAYMEIAIQEARLSLRQGNHGFGAVIIRDRHLVAKAHEREQTEGDPTAHAEMRAIRLAASILGRDLSSCTLISTHEPCPMCAGAILWARLGRVAYGCSIEEARAQGRDRIGMGCEEIFSRSGTPVEVQSGLMKDECAVLYSQAVRREIARLRDASEAPIVERDEGRIVFHSRNSCPTLEACRILGLDTRTVCRLYNEGATDALVKQVDPSLAFSRNYERLRPRSHVCEEIIEHHGKPIG